MAPFDLSGPGLSKRVSYNVAGEVVARRDSDQPSERGGTRYISVGGNPLGRYGTPSTPDAPFIDFNYNVDPVSDEYPASVPGSYIVSEQGETVRDVARAVYGDANLWYLVADANALAPDDVLRPGQVLSVPNAVQPSGNTADTFRPIGDLVGDTRPDLPVPPPPPDKSCGTFGIILVIVVAVVVSVVSFNTLSGPATAAVSSVLGGSTAAGAVATTGGAILAGTAAGAAASAASQLTAIAAGLQDDFSWSDVGRSALQSGLTAGALQGFGLVGPDADALSWLGDFAEVGRAVVSNAVSQGIGMGLDMQDEFNWNALAGATAASSLVGVTGTAVDRLSLSPNGFSETFLQQFAAGTINTGTQMLLEGGGKLDVRSIAADAFGNALGNSIVGHLRSSDAEQQSRIAQMRVDMAVEEASRSGAIGSATGAGGASPVTISQGEWYDLVNSGRLGTPAYAVAQLERLGINAAPGAGGGVQTFAYRDPVADLAAPIPLPVAQSISQPPGFWDSFDSARGSMRDYWSGMQDRAVAGGSFLGYAGAGGMRLLGDVGYGVFETGASMLNDPRSGFAGFGKGLLNFGPEAFNAGVNIAKTSLDGLTLLAETAPFVPGGYFEGFRQTDPYNIGLLAPYSNSAEVGGAFLANVGLGVGAARYGAYSVRSPVLFEPVPAYAPQGMTFIPPGVRLQNPLVAPRSQLLPGEGAVATYDELIAAGTKGDNITPHHIPSANHMAQYGVTKGDGIAINMQHPVPGSGGRHRMTFTYGTNADVGLSARDALAAGVWDARSIYRQQGLYDAHMRQQLQEVIRQNKLAHPEIFMKPPR